MFLAGPTSAGRQTYFGIVVMDIKIVVVMLLIGFLGTLYHAGKPQDSAKPTTA